MTITIYGSDYDALWQEANIASQNVESQELSETVRLVPESLGQGYIKSIDFNGINILLFNYQLHDDLFIIRKDKDFSKISREFGFNLSGDRCGKRTGENFIEWGNCDDCDEYVQIAYAKEPILKVDISIHQSAYGLGQSIAEVLEELPRETKERIGDRNFLEEIDRITPAMRSALKQILDCPFQGKTKQIYLESKCLELITLKLEQLKQKDKPIRKLSFLKSDDIDRIHLAKTILTDNFDSPPSLTELARQVGLNDCTLKRGFREVFGTTREGELLDPERGTQYEIGVKTEFGQMAANLALYQITKTNVAREDPEDPDFSIPIGEVRSRGIELDVGGEITPGWNITASVFFADPEVTVGDEDTPEGDTLENAPREGASIWTTYELQQGSLQGAGLGFGLFYVGDRETGIPNDFVLPSYVRADASLFYRRENWNAQLNFKNLFDTEYFEGTAGNVTLRGAPFTLLGRVSVEF